MTLTKPQLVLENRPPTVYIFTPNNRKGVFVALQGQESDVNICHLIKFMIVLNSQLETRRVPLWRKGASPNQITVPGGGFVVSCKG